MGRPSKTVVSLFPIDSRIHTFNDLLEKYDKATLLDNSMSDHVLFPTLRTNVFMEPNVRPDARTSLKIKLDFRPLKQSSLLFLHKIPVFGAIKEVMRCTKFLIS